MEKNQASNFGIFVIGFMILKNMIIWYDIYIFAHLNSFQYLKQLFLLIKFNIQFKLLGQLLLLMKANILNLA